MGRLRTGGPTRGGGLWEGLKADGGGRERPYGLCHITPNAVVLAHRSGV